MTINLFFIIIFHFFIFLHFSTFIHGNFISSSLACLNFNFQTIVSYIYIVTVSLHIVATFRIFIKSPVEGRLDCPKYRENQLTRRFFFAVFSL